MNKLQDVESGALVDALLQLLSDYSNYGLIIGEDDDNRITTAQNRISKNRDEIRKEQEFIKKIRDYRKRKRQLDK